MNAEEYQARLAAANIETLPFNRNGLTKMTCAIAVQFGIAVAAVTVAIHGHLVIMAIVMGSPATFLILKSMFVTTCPESESDTSTSR